MLTLLTALAVQIDLGGGKPAKTEVKFLDVRLDRPKVRPGEPFKLSFDLQIPEGWHIYPTTPTTTGSVTKVVAEGFDVLGPYEEPKPKTHPKSEFLEAYDYHEGKITIAVRLRAKAEAVAGKQDIKARLEYQICKSVCMDGRTAFAFPIEIARRPSSDIRLVSIKPAKADLKVGESVKAAFEIEIPKGWHIYPTTPTTTGTPTAFVFEAAEVDGRIEEPKPKVHPPEEDQKAYDYHDGTITMAVPLHLKPGPKPGPFEVVGYVDYQICSDNGLCVPAKLDFSFPVKVVDGQVVPPPSAPQGGAAGAAKSELDSRGLFGILVFAAGGGLLSLVMPCVYPLIPITLTFFIKQGAGSRATSIGMSTAYAAGIIVVFTGIGFLFSALLGADGARVFAANPWVNLSVGGLFLWFTFSLFGLYDISLPQWLVGGVTGQRRSGIGGSFILGALFSVVTFTCTIPVAATILALAAGSGTGSKSAGLLAMLVYSAVMAAPFFVLGLFPGLIKSVPKSGGWLHTVKVTAGFGELALTLYYFSKADVVWGLGFLTRDLMVAVWIAALVFMSLYLLKVFKMKGDEEDVAPVGVFRMLWALVFLLGAVQFASVFAGKPAGALAFVLPGAIDEKVHPSMPPALEEAKRTGKPVFLEFTGVTCANCQLMKAKVIDTEEVKKVLQDFVFAELYTDAGPHKAENAKLQDETFGTVALPLYVVVDSRGKELARTAGVVSRQEFVDFLRKGQKALGAPSAGP